MSTTDTDILQQIDAIRGFNRVYTRQIGLLEEHLLHGPYSLTQARLLIEMALDAEAALPDLRARLGIDAGYVSRLLAGFEGDGLIERRADEQDARRSIVALTAKGRGVVVGLEAASRGAVGAMVEHLDERGRARLIEAMGAIERLLDKETPAGGALVLRPHRPGDMGWIIHRQAVIYASEHGFDARFEALLGEISAEFLRNYDAARERSWMAELDGAIVGSIFLVRQSDEVAKLRMLYVEPEARGHGIGWRLVQECITTARTLGYRELTLWTNHVLLAARRLYERAGFELLEEEPHSDLGPPMHGQRWRLML